MNLQFGWLPRREPACVASLSSLGSSFLWLASLANAVASPVGQIMDLLWFPTGGGKTEAYLALTAFVILLRRLRATDQDAGVGCRCLHAVHA